MVTVDALNIGRALPHSGIDIQTGAVRQFQLMKNCQKMASYIRNTLQLNVILMPF
jgi:hypothetical protein